MRLPKWDKFVAHRPRLRNRIRWDPPHHSIVFATKDCGGAIGGYEDEIRWSESGNEIRVGSSVTFSVGTYGRLVLIDKIPATEGSFLKWPIGAMH